MAETTYGSKAFLYGIGGNIAECVIQSTSLDKADKINATVLDEQGRQIHGRYDDQTDTITFDVIIQANYNVPELASVLSYKNVNYRVESTGEPKVNNDFQRVNITAIKDEYMSLS